MHAQINTLSFSRSSLRKTFRTIRRGVSLLLTLALLAGTMKAQTTVEARRAAAERAFAEGVQLFKEGTEQSLQKAIQKLEVALSLVREFDDHESEALALMLIGRSYDNLDEKQRALPYYIQALPLLREAGNREEEANTLNNVGLIYKVTGETRKALDYYNRALSLFQALNNRGGEALTLSNIGEVYNVLGEKQKALQYFNQALPLWRAVEDRSGEATTLNNIGAVFNYLGERQRALEYYNQALQIRRAINEKRGEANTLNNIGGVYGELGEYQRALDYYNQALPLRRAVADRRGEAHTLSNIGAVYSYLDKDQIALNYFNQALPLFQALGDRGGQAYTLVNMGRAYSSLGEKRKALDYFNQALPIWQAVGDRRGQAYTLNNIGEVYDALDEKRKALDYYNRALPLWRDIRSHTGESITLYHVARQMKARGDLIAARAQIETTLNIIESLRSKVASQQLRASYFASVQKYYEFYIDLLMRLHRQHPNAGHDAEALKASERGRARSLLEILIEAKADIRQGLDPQLLERERSLQQLLTAKEAEQVKRLSGTHTAEGAAAIKREIDALLNQYQEVEAQIRARSPRYAALTQPQPLSLREIQQQVLDPDTLLLEYSLGEDRSYLWAVTPTTMNSYELPKRAEIETVARRFYDLLTARNRRVKGETREQKQARINQSDAQLPEAAASLSQMLLSPVTAHLKKKRLLIISDGALQYVPFGALPAPEILESSKTNTQPKSQDSIRQTPGTRIPLIIEHEIVSLPSASTIAVLRREVAGRKPAPMSFAVLADPVFGTDDERFQSGTSNTRPRRANPTDNSDSKRILEQDDNDLDAPVGGVSLVLGRARFKRLRYTQQEAERILAIVPAGESMQAFGFKANRATATSAGMKRYRLVHFATHGYLDTERPELSAIVLSLVDEKGAPQPGFLRTHEIYNLQLPAELVVLSACQTGLGKEIRGEGLVGLTRGFMYAGARRVVVSLWSVSDRATAELMEKFYRAMLIDKVTPVAALRAAQIEIWKQKQWEAPYYWAAFTLQGEWR